VPDFLHVVQIRQLLLLTKPSAKAEDGKSVTRSAQPKLRSAVIVRMVNAIARTIPTVNKNLAGFGLDFGAMFPSWYRSWYGKNLVNNRCRIA